MLNSPQSRVRFYVRDSSGPTRREIDPRKLEEYLEAGREHADYALVPPGDARPIERLYGETSLRVTALLDAPAGSSGPLLVALPRERLGLPEPERPVR